MAVRSECQDCGRKFFPRRRNYVLCLSCGARAFLAIRKRLSDVYEDLEDRLPLLETVRCGADGHIVGDTQCSDAITDQYRSSVVEMCEQSGGYEKDDANVWIFRPAKISGVMSEHEMRFAADELRKRNRDVSANP